MTDTTGVTPGPWIIVPFVLVAACVAFIPIVASWVVVAALEPAGRSVNWLRIAVAVFGPLVTFSTVYLLIG